MMAHIYNITWLYYCFQCWGGVDWESRDVRVQLLQEDPGQWYLHFHSSIFQQWVLFKGLTCVHCSVCEDLQCGLALSLFCPLPLDILPNPTGKDQTLRPLISLSLSFSFFLAVSFSVLPLPPSLPPSSLVYFLSSLLISLTDIRTGEHVAVLSAIEHLTELTHVLVSDT